MRSDQQCGQNGFGGKLAFVHAPHRVPRNRPSASPLQKVCVKAETRGG